MFGKAKNKMGKSSNIISLGMGLVCTGLITLVGGILATILIYTECLTETKMGLAAVITVCMAALGGAIVTAKKVGERRMIFCLANGALYFLLLISVNWLCYDGAFRGVLGSALTIIGCSVVASMLATRQKRQKISRFSKKIK